MELVRGIKITEYCDQNYLTTEERLELFTQVCHAVQHAHQKGIIHRDLKPSNILVTLHDGVPVPKVIDFGIAKATSDQRLTDKTVFTAFEQFIGTPAYMSPEQAEMSGLDIDTRSDIFSLGVLLYELLTGQTPLDANELLRSGMNEMRRKIREDEPPRPSTRLSTMQAEDLTTIANHRQADAPKLIHLIHGDLDWIVMKCLEKDRTRRYETANELAMDVQRHLASEPVRARSPTQVYRFRKFVRRNKLGFSAATAIAVALIAGLCVSGWALMKERTARARAEEAQGLARMEAIKSEKVARFLRDMLYGVGPAIRRHDQRRSDDDTAQLQRVLAETARRVPELEGQPTVQADILTIVGSAFSELGDYTNAVAMHSRALTLRKAIYGNQHPEVAKSLQFLVSALKAQGLDDQANKVMREAQPIETTSSTNIGAEPK
jgi:hypothetical protein